MQWVCGGKGAKGEGRGRFVLSGALYLMLLHTSAPAGSCQNAQTNSRDADSEIEVVTRYISQNAAYAQVTQNRNPDLGGTRWETSSSSERRIGQIGVVGIIVASA